MAVLAGAINATCPVVFPAASVAPFASSSMARVVPPCTVRIWVAIVLKNPGLAVPMPTLPEALMSMLLVGAPGRMRNGSRLPPVRSRTKKFASLAPISQVCAVKPLAVVCSSRCAGVSPVAMWMLSPGVAVRQSRSCRRLSTNSELVGAAPTTVNGTVANVVFSMENLFRPPDRRIVGGQLPVIVGKARRRAGIVELDPGVVLLQPDRIEAEGFAVDAIQPDAGAALHDEIVRNDRDPPSPCRL